MKQSKRNKQHRNIQYKLFNMQRMQIYCTHTWGQSFFTRNIFSMYTRYRYLLKRKKLSRIKFSCTYVYHPAEDSEVDERTENADDNRERWEYNIDRIPQGEIPHFIAW